MGDDIRQEGAFPQVGEGADGPGGEPDDDGAEQHHPVGVVGQQIGWVHVVANP
jgi:hypothetical protein